MTDTTSALRIALEALRGNECWCVIGGRGTGSVVQLGFGDRLPGPFSSNQLLTLEERQFQPEASLYVECAWRLETSTEVLFSWTQMSASDRWADFKDAVRGRRVASVVLSEPGLDLNIGFDGDVAFRVFCDQDEEGDNYSVRLPGEVVTVGALSAVVMEKRTRT